MIIVSHISKEKSGKKNIVALTTMHDKMRPKKTRDKRPKPQVLVMYDCIKD